MRKLKVSRTSKELNLDTLRVRRYYVVMLIVAVFALYGAGKSQFTASHANKTANQVASVQQSQLAATKLTCKIQARGLAANKYLTAANTSLGQIVNDLSASTSNSSSDPQIAKFLGHIEAFASNEAQYSKLESKQPKDRNCNVTPTKKNRIPKP